MEDRGSTLRKKINDRRRELNRDSTLLDRFHDPSRLLLSERLRMMYLSLISGFVILLFCGDLLVRGAVSLALKLGIPSMLIGRPDHCRLRDICTGAGCFHQSSTYRRERHCHREHCRVQYRQCASRAGYSRFDLPNTLRSGISPPKYHLYGICDPYLHIPRSVWSACILARTDPLYAPASVPWICRNPRSKHSQWIWRLLR